MKYILLILSNIFVWAIAGFAQNSYTVLYDTHQSEITGAANMRTLHKVLYTAQEKFIPDTIITKKHTGGKLLNMGYRAAKCFLVDFQQDFFIALIQHEAFGHGARYREFGFTENSFHFSPFFPFGGGRGNSNAGKLPGGTVVTEEESITCEFGGVEANLVLANNMADGMVSGNSIHYRDALLFLIAQNNQLDYIWLSKNPNFKNGDINGYINSVNLLYAAPGKKQFSIDDLAYQSLITLLNPIQLYSAFTLVYKYGIKGQRKLGNVPMIRLGNVRYLPAFNYSLTPFGSQYHFTNYLKCKQVLLVGDLTLGDNRFHNFYGVDLRGLNILYTPRLHANAYLSLWDQPELQLDGYVIVSKNTSGALIKADLCVQPLKFQKNVGCFLQVGYKTKGYTIGEPLDKGVIFRFGLNFVPNE